MDRGIAIEVGAALDAAGFTAGDDYTIAPRGVSATVALGLDLVGSTPAKGGNAAGSLLSALTVAGFAAEPANWEHLLGGGECAVFRVAYPTRLVAQRLYGVAEPSKAQLTAAAQWCRAPGRGIEPTNPGFVPLLWPAVAVDAALAERGEVRASGRRSAGNRTSGERRAAAARRGWASRRARSGEED